MRSRALKRVSEKQMESNRSRGGGGGNSLKLRLASIFRSPSLLRSSCNTSNSGDTAAPSRALLVSVDDPLGPTFSLPHRKEQATPEDARGRSLSFAIRNDHLRCASDASAAWRRSVDCIGRSSPPVPKSEERKHMKPKKNRAKRSERRASKPQKKRLLTNGYGFSSSSSGQNGVEEGFFSSDEREAEEDDEGEEETEAFFSSWSFSSDSSEFYQRPKPKTKKKGKRNQLSQTWGLCRGLQPLVSISSSVSSFAAVRAAETKEAKASFAVVKRSSNPYNDFRSSMVEMIMERQIFGAEELESLLQSYLSLNSPHLRPVILQAFSDIWVVLFGQ